MRRECLLIVLAAAVAAAVGFRIFEIVQGHELRAPALGGSAVMDVGLLTVVIGVAAAGLAAWGSIALLERTVARTRPGASGAGIAGGSPQPGGWNRFQTEVDDIDETVQKLRAMGARFRGDVVQGRGGRQVLVEDASGNAVELFQPAL